jgi:hypothetical protein
MRSLFRRRTDRATGGVSFCDQCAQVCTAHCRSTAHLDRVRLRALAHLPPLR